MATFTWPISIRTGPVDYAIAFAVQITVARNGRVTTQTLPGDRWIATVRFENDVEIGDAMRPKIEAMITKLEGGAHRLLMPHWGRPIPNGTLRGSPTVGSSIVAGAKSFTMINANGGVKAGDIIGLPGQMLMVVDDATPSGSNLTVNVRPAIRTAHSAGATVTWNKPTTLWIPRSAMAGPFPYAKAKFRPGFSFELVEAPV